MQQVLALLLGRIESYRETEKIMPATVCYKAVTGDIITEYAYGKSVGNLSEPDYNVSFYNGLDKLNDLSKVRLHLPWLGPLMESLPLPVMSKLVPELVPFIEMKDQWRKQILEIKNSNNKEAGKDTIFHGLLYNDLPDSEKSMTRLIQEAHVIIMAGQETTALVLSALTYELLTNPACLTKLKEALALALPNESETPTMSKVEQIPYLTAVLYETLRLHPPSGAPITRVAPNEAILYPKPAPAPPRPQHNKTPAPKSIIIPPKTPISMPFHLMMCDPTIFPNPKAWIPDRWIENPKLDRYILTFGRGTRMCIGIELAWQELYVIAAGVFRKYNRYDPMAGKVDHTLELYKTTRERDVDMNADAIIIRLGKGSQGVRLRVR
ncbi:hypothetical protein MMC31_006810 [Peltigera leucophlebia]|nr:hypothetical protein [Peltigera leucophlebia]